MWLILSQFLGGVTWHMTCVGVGSVSRLNTKRDKQPVVKAPRGIAKGWFSASTDRVSDGLVRDFSPTIKMATRLLGVCLLGSSLGACAMGSMGAMMGGGADGVAALSSEDGTQSARASVESPEHQEFTAMADIVDTPVWAALGPIEQERGGFLNMGNVVGMLLAGHDNEDATEQEPSAIQAERYVASLDGIFDDRNQVATAMSVDIFRKNSESRRFLAAARDVVGSHDWSVATVNAAFQAGAIDRATYRAHLNQLDADRRVLGRVVTSLQEQRRIFNRARAILVADNPRVNLARVDEEMASLAQYEEMAARLSATISGEAEVSS